MTRLTREGILELFDLLNEELAETGTVGELYVVGGAVMCMALDARDSTQGVDAVVKPARVVLAAARRAAGRIGAPEDWLNDAVKGFLGPGGAYRPFLELSSLRVFAAEPHYLLALKCVALRLGPDFHDLDDVRFLLRHLDVRGAKDALEIVERYVPAERVPIKTRLALEEIYDRT